MGRNNVVTVTVLAALLAGGVAHAASKSDANRVVDELLKCEDVPDAQRLACFETHLGELKQLRQHSGGLVAAREPRPVAQPVEATIATVSDLSNGQWLFVLSDRSIWRTQDGIYFLPHVGDKVRITTAALGSFDAMIGKERPIKVRPLR